MLNFNIDHNQKQRKTSNSLRKSHKQLKKNNRMLVNNLI